MAKRIVSVTEGDDIDLIDNEALPYEHVKNIGHGHSAIVEKIKNVNTGIYLARKTFRLHHRQSQQRQAFKTETAIIRHLAAHPHIIRIFATFTTRQEVGLILDPVADGGDLKSFLSDCNDVSQLSTAQRTIIRSGFGCLSAGLAFIHKAGIRHKDIKPANILIHRGNMIYTDFGYSLKHDIGNSTTSGVPGYFTVMYCAPEVIRQRPRNSKADIFSLGCVFLELLAVYNNSDLVAGSTVEPYCDRIEAIQRKLITPGAFTDYPWLRNIISNMLNESADLRPKAEYVVMQIRGEDQEYFCSSCTSMQASSSTAAIPSQDLVNPTDVSTTNDWTWSEEHGDHYRVTYHNGVTEYTWFKTTRNPPSRTYYHAQQMRPFQSPGLQPSHDSINFSEGVNTPASSAGEMSPPGTPLDISSSIPNFIPGTPNSGWSESIDASYRMRTGRDAREFFVPGRVFSVLSSLVGSVQIRRFIVVRVRREYVETVGIFTYGNRGTMKPGCNPRTHAVVYSLGQQPTIFVGEQESGLINSPIGVQIPNPNDVLSPASRIRFDKTFPVEVNMKVKDLGTVVPSDMSILIGHWREERDRLNFPVPMQQHQRIACDDRSNLGHQGTENLHKLPSTTSPHSLSRPDFPY